MCFKVSDGGRKAGFTLVEVLIAVAILATVATLVFGSFVTTTQIVSHARGSNQERMLARDLLRTIANELASGQPNQLSPWFGENRDQGGTPADTLSFVTSAVPGWSGGGPSTGMVQVVYAREGPKLLRFARRNLYGLTDESIERAVVATQVIGFNVRYFDSKAQAWVDQWDGRVRNGIPRAILIELTLQQGQQGQRTFTEWVSLPS
jgi:general secretion pathway protein J